MIKKVKSGLYTLVIVMIMILCVLIMADNSDAKIVWEETESVYSHDDECIRSERVGYIYTGDSRIRRLNITVDLKHKKDTWVVCKSGKGYNWFNGAGLPEIERIMKEKTYIDKWVIISGWGVNDLWNVNTYINRYKKLLISKWKNADLYLMSVNPVNGSKEAKYRSIDSFNDKIQQYIKQSGASIYYIDTNHVMKSEGYSTIDGLHYTESTNRLIYETVRERLDGEYARLNYESLTMNINSCKTISLDSFDGRVKWSVQDKNVVKIINLDSGAASVTVKAVHAGTSGITASCNGREFNCEINVVDDGIMIAYFTYSGETELAAEYIQKRIGGDLVLIDRKQIYPYSKDKFNEEIKNELEANARPELDTYIKDVSVYNLVYLCYPLWLGYAPRPVCTFAETYLTCSVEIKPLIVNIDEAAAQSGAQYNEQSDKQLKKEVKKSLKELKGLSADASYTEPLIINGAKVRSKKVKKDIRDFIKI